MQNFDYTKVEPNRLQNTAVNLDDSIRMLESALKTVDNALHETLRPTWSGPACSQFFTQYSKDSQGFTVLVELLRTYNEQLKQAAGAYDDADNKALSLVNELKTV